jgi:hypothetical protein
VKSIINHVFVVIVCFFGASACIAQVSDDFSDLDFSNDPAWTGDADKFIVNGNERLQLDDSDEGISTLQTNFAESTLDGKEWRFWVKHSFSGSDNNQSRIYLSTITEDIEYTGTTSAGAQGYFISLGESGSEDAIRLFRDDDEGQSVTEIAAGTLGAVSTSFEVLIKVTRTGDDWSILADFGDGFLPEGTGTDGTYSTSTGLGVACKYTSSNSTAFQFDDFYFGEPELDEEAPGINEVTVPNAAELVVSFDETVDESTAEDVDNYNVVGIGSPQTAARNELQPNEVTLSFTDDFPELVEQTLEINGVMDLFDNAMDLETVNFTWVPTSSAGERDVVFNEILADPSPVIGLPEVEYVELFNASAAGFDLANWTFVNTTTEKVLPSYVLAPGEFVLICDADLAAELEPFGNVIGIASFTALSNAGDSLTLRNDQDDVIDIVVYDEDWYGNSQLAEGGTSLEQVNPFAACSDAGNWMPSSNSDGGTPGSVNSVLDETLDEQAPNFEGISVVDLATVQLFFDEPVEANSVDVGSFSITNSINVQNATLIEEDIVELSLNPALEIGVSYILSISMLADCEGNAINPAVEVELITGFQPEIGDLIFNEFLPDPDEGLASPNAEFIELYNRSEKLLDLQGVSISGGAIEQQVLVEPGEYQLLASDDDPLAFLVYPSTHFMSDFPGLVNTGRDLVLLNAMGEMLDSLSYDLDWYGDPSKDDGGYSLELINPDDPCSDHTNWTASFDGTGATPGAVNSVNNTDPDITPASPLFTLTLSPEIIQIVFDEPLDEVSIITADYSFYQVAGTDLEELSINVADASQISLNTIELLLDTPVEQGNIYVVRIDGVEDCWGNQSAISDLAFGLEDVAEPGDLVINEILSNPVNNGSDYVEIYNRSNRNISIEDWKLANVDDGEIANFKLITADNRILFPGDYLCMSTDIAQIPGQYPFAHVENLLKMESLPTYSNDEGTVVLVDPLGVVSDLVAYNEDMHFALLNDLDGVSLERIDYSQSSDDETNWLSAAESQNFGTPGYQNSQISLLGIVDGEITIQPEVFSPDNDGVDDVVDIAYSFEHSGLVANVTIFDKIGREIRRIAQNDLLGTSGKYNWDGINEEREKASMGIYIVYFEVFDTDGNVSHFKEVCVLGHQLD